MAVETQDKLKLAMRAIERRLPNADVGTGFLVHPNEVKAELQQMTEKTQLIESFERYNRADDLLADFSLPAARRLIYEMFFGFKSRDRQSAARAVMEHTLGKPVQRVFNVNAEVGNYNEMELEGKTKDLLSELAQTDPKRMRALLSELGYAGDPPTDVKRGVIQDTSFDETSEGLPETEKFCSESGISD